MKEARVLIGFHAVAARLRAEPASVIEILADETRHDARIENVLSARLAEQEGFPLVCVSGQGRLALPPILAFSLPRACRRIH